VDVLSPHGRYPHGQVPTIDFTRVGGSSRKTTRAIERQDHGVVRVDARTAGVGRPSTGRYYVQYHGERIRIS